MNVCGQILFNEQLFKRVNSVFKRQLTIIERLSELGISDDPINENNIEILKEHQEVLAQFTSVFEMLKVNLEIEKNAAEAFVQNKEMISHATKATDRFAELSATVAKPPFITVGLN